MIKPTETLSLSKYLLTATLLCLTSAGGAWADAEGAASASGFTATAASSDGKLFQSPPLPNRMAAATTAVANCQQDTNSVCELVKVNGQALTTVADVKAALPDDRHPLALWEFNHGDARVFVAGSVHILKPGFYPLPRQFTDAYAKTDHLVLEVDTAALTTTEIQQQSLKYGMLPTGQTLSGVLPRELHSELGIALAEYGLPIAQFEPFKPNLVTQQLTVFALISVGYTPDSGLESYFRGRVGERQILQLESMDFQLDLLLNVDLPTQVDMTRATLAQLGEFEGATADLISAWLAGDDETFGKLMAAQNGETPNVRKFMRKLIEERNHSMTDTIIGYMNQGGSYFVLVGTGHITGEEGIPALLQKAGYKGRRIYSDDTIE